jgi:hypothetical protein
MRVTMGILAALLLFLSLAACPTVNKTVTQPPSEAGVGGQLISRQIDDHTWRLYWPYGTFFEDSQTAEDYLLFRAATLTVEKGFDWFSIAGQHVQMFTGTAPVDVLGTYDARQVMKFVGPRVLPQRPDAGGPSG